MASAELDLYARTLLGGPLGLLVEPERLGRVRVEGQQVVPELRQLLVQIGEATLQLLACVVLATPQAPQLILDMPVQLVIVAELGEVLADQREDVLLDDVGGDGVPLRALVLVTRRVPAARVVPRLVSLAARVRRAGELAAAHSTEDQPGEQVLGLHRVAAVVRVPLLGLGPSPLHRVECLHVDQGGPCVLAHDPVVLGPLLDAFVLALDAGAVAVPMPLAQRPTVVDAPADVGRVLQDRDDRLDGEVAAA